MTNFQTITYKKRFRKELIEFPYYEVFVNGIYVGEVDKCESASRTYWYFQKKNDTIPTMDKKNKREWENCHNGHWDSTRQGAILCEIGDYINQQGVILK